ncbi:methylated-DNA--[protein]-cysteine S-methyltransferase [Streptomyces oceani]|uniref:Methylated-DNA--protein-cysteine methyltransferase n=1 Tax=Streptomyces oceani TaxID=1075402 RepID=A0A1E7JZ23_9ACTN|nr:methylated-DNA--[protein]-cysteine S-methyltransferase [Streptomyces oceani]OEU96919.1 hypothetical protein AN216_18400 [Streptomyces oceani]
MSRTSSTGWAWTRLETPIGPLLLAATEVGLLRVCFHAHADVTERAVGELRARRGVAPLPYGRGSSWDTAAAGGTGRAAPEGGSGIGDAADPDAAGAGVTAAHPVRVLSDTVDELTAYFHGSSRGFTVPLDWSLTSGFHELVLRELASRVPYGGTVGYQTLADRVGEPGAARAVGLAMGANPLPLVVPCHRVLESGGGIGGFGGGLETKRALLALEGVLPEPLFPLD